MSPSAVRPPPVEGGLATIASPIEPLELESGGVLRDAGLAYQSVGPADSDRVVLVCHALTGDANAAGSGDASPGRAKGWWHTLVGPGRAIDTRTTRVICTNVLGGCAGSTGPTSLNSKTGRAWGAEFPRVTVRDMVRAQARLLDRLGEKAPIVVVGGSLGGFQALEWIREFPERVSGAGVIASATSLSPFGLAFNHVGRNAIWADAKFNRGRYEPDDPPHAGLAVARQLAHLTYRSDRSMNARFPRGEGGQSGSGVGSYLEYKGKSFTERFDANSYLTLLDAMDTYDANAQGHLRGELSAFSGSLLVGGFSSDWLFTPEQSRALAAIARSAGVRTTLEIFESSDGHDAFLLPNEPFERSVRGLIDEAAGPRS
ncbi:MAG: homoserine O-acetyltransferase [Planctomycetota bacterium]